MADKPFDADDPLAITAAPCPDGDLDTQVAIMVEEFLKMGTSRETMLQLFRNPFYTFLHACRERVGDGAVAALVERVAGKWGVFRFTTRHNMEGGRHA